MSRVDSVSSNHIKNPLQGCLVCTLRPFLIFGIFVGASPLSWNCQHSKKPSRPTFTVNKFWYIVSFLIVLIFFGMVGFNFYDLYVNFSSKMSEKMENILYLFTDTLYIIVAGTSGLISLCQISQKIKEYNGIVCIMEAKSIYGLDYIFRISNANILRRKGFLFYVLVPLVMLVQSAYVFYLWMSGDRSNYKGILQEFFAIFGGYAVIVILFQFIISIQLYIILFQELNDHAKSILEPYRKPIDPEDFTNNKRWDLIEFHPETFGLKEVSKISKNLSQKSASITKQLPLTVKLSKLRRLHAAYIFNVKVLNEYYNPTKLIHFSIILISLVINIYLLIKSFMDNWEMDRRILSIGKIIATMGSTLVLFNEADTVCKTAQEISSFLYSFPISGLKPQEAAEVEMYLEMIHTQRPVLSASGVFNLGMGLLASISGTVVTYVLVALQFRVSWQDGTQTSNITNLSNVSDIS